MTFKKDWEKASDELPLSQDQLKELIRGAFPNRRIQSYEIISGGCANLF